MMSAVRVPFVAVVAIVALAACASERPSDAPVTSPSVPATTTAAPRSPGDDPPITDQPATSEPVGWQRRTDAPLALTEVAAAAHDGLIWVAGGLDGSGAAVTAVLRYDPVGDTWDRAADLPEAVHHSSLVSTGTALLLVGGYAGNGFDRPTAAVWRLDPTAGSWVAAAALPEPRAAGGAGWDGEDLVVYAGGVGPGGVSDGVFTLESGAWRSAAPLSVAREHLAVAGPDEAGWVSVIGGRRGGLDTNLGRVDLIDGDKTLTLGDLLIPRGGVAAFHAPDLGACLVGGEGPGGTFADVECVDDGGLVTLPSMAHPRHGLGAAVVDRTAYALLGGEQPGLFVSSIVEALDLDGP